MVAYPTDPIYRFSLGAPNFSKLHCSCLRKSLLQPLRNTVSLCTPPLNNYNGLGLFLQIKHICIFVFRIADPRAFVNLAPSTNTWSQGGRSQKPHVCNRARWCDQHCEDSTFVPWPFCRGQDQKYLRSSAPPDVRLAIVTFQAAGEGDVQWLLCQGLDLLWSRRDEERKWPWIETCTLGVGSDAI